MQNIEKTSLSSYLQKDLLSDDGIQIFQKLIYTYYINNGREFAWRKTTDPYAIVVSEIMLQQTQTDRVKLKYEQFMQNFQSIELLARAPFSSVLATWQGLGYNRRALFLHNFAQEIVTKYNGIIPSCQKILSTFKGIGPNTAGSICAFAFNLPVIFIETNIRSVFIHTFFNNHKIITDKKLVPLIEQTVDAKQARIWYYALMDYGAMLKKSYENPNRKSAHYNVQSKFEGSNRQVRGLILKYLTMHQTLTKNQISDLISNRSELISNALSQLQKDSLIVKVNNYYLIKN